MFVFRRIAAGRFAHIGGVGRGAGWAGIVEIGLDDERLVREALAANTVARRHEPAPWHVLGPYYAASVAVVPVNADVFVLFGSLAPQLAEMSDTELLELGRSASEGLIEVEPAKRLADELEVLQVVHDFLQAPPDSLEQALQRLVDHATEALSCDLGVLYLDDTGQIAVSDRRAEGNLDAAELRGSLRAIHARGRFPICIQEATAAELPAPFSSADGVLAYYLLELTQPEPGLLLLLHTTAANPRGFTLLCQSLGAKLVQAAEPLLVAARLRDQMNEQLSRAAVEARRDPLTGLANRLAWNERLRSTVPCSDSPVSIVQIDCRGLKQINDARGHHVGDELLRRVAKALTDSVQENDLVARLGGDEFAILLCGSDEQQAATTVQQIKEAISDSSGDFPTPIGVAIGTATTRRPELAATHREADAQMLAAKGPGSASNE
jgi:diguanylate cyclase (GGDEF)-like protein